MIKKYMELFQTVWGLNHVDEVFVRIGVYMKHKFYQSILLIVFTNLYISRCQQLIQGGRSGPRLMAQ